MLIWKESVMVTRLLVPTMQNIKGLWKRIFDELKKVGHYRYPDGGFVDNKTCYWDYQTKSYKVDKKYYWD